MTLCIDTLCTFSCIIPVFYFFVLLFTVHLCAIDMQFNKCNLLTYLHVYDLHVFVSVYITCAGICTCRLKTSM